MIAKRKNRDGSTTYGVRVHRADKHYEWVGSFRSTEYPTVRAALRAAKRAEADALDTRARKPTALTVEQYAERFLAEYKAHRKASSYGTAVTALKRFREDFGGWELNTITRLDAKDWALKAPRSTMQYVVTMMNHAVEDELIERNPFRGLARQTRGRSDEAPPTEDEMTKLLEACAVHGKHYAPMMRAMLTFAAYSGVRPGELFELKWDDIDFDKKRVHVSRGLYRGRVDTPKSNKPKEISLTPPARDAILGLPRTSEYVFTSKTGRRMSQSTLSAYWREVTAKAGLDFAFYMASKHYCVHHLWAKRNLSERVIAEQMGWTIDETGDAIRKLLRIYGHGRIGALDEIDKAFEDDKVVQLREVPRTQGAHG